MLEMFPKSVFFLNAGSKASHLNLETDSLIKKERKLKSIKSKIKKEKL